MKFFSMIAAAVALVFSVSAAEAQTKRLQRSGERGEQTADVVSGVLGSASSFGKGRWTTGVGYAGSAVPIVFALGHMADVEAACERPRSRAVARECTRLRREAEERLGLSIIYATPLGDVKEIVEGLEKGDPKRVVCGGIGLAGMVSPARGVGIAGGVCSLIDTAEALSRDTGRGPRIARAPFDPFASMGNGGQ